MSDWTVMGRGRRFTFDNPQPALYDRIAAVKALVGDVPVRAASSSPTSQVSPRASRNTLLMLDGIEVEFPPSTGPTRLFPNRGDYGCLEPVDRAAATPAPVYLVFDRRLRAEFTGSRRPVL